jgi:hypothetical protein
MSLTIFTQQTAFVVEYAHLEGCHDVAITPLMHACVKWKHRRGLYTGMRAILALADLVSIGGRCTCLVVT